MERRVRGEIQPAVPKPEKEKAAAVKLIVDAKPDILGVCEMGPEADLLDLQARLKAAGLDLPHHLCHQGEDEERHLAILSKFPLTGNQSVKTLTFDLGGKQLPMQRGILDVTIQPAADYAVRLVGVHLKSRRETEEGDQALMRRSEAQLLRTHLDKILTANPDENVLLFGDFNDTKNEPPIKLVQGNFGEPTFLRDIWLEDDDEERWTYYWDFADKYERIDFIFASRAFFPEVALKESFLVSDRTWNDASDHRPLVLLFSPVNKAPRGR
jgi:endonuclease/exonuclease/phosphatase family metal-dependent hydrolase